MKPDRALAIIEETASHHRYGHHCHDGGWYNQRTGAGIPCGVVTALEVAAADVAQLHTQVHEAAHSPEQVDTVAAAMLSTPLDELDPEQQEGWRHLARLAIEALAADLDRDLLLEARAESALERYSQAVTAMVMAGVGTEAEVAEKLGRALNDPVTEPLATTGPRIPGHSHAEFAPCVPEQCTGHPSWKEAQTRG